MHLVTRVLAWAGVVLFGSPAPSPEPGQTAPRTGLETSSSNLGLPVLPVHDPSPGAWSTTLSGPHRRKAHPSWLPTCADDSVTSALVRAYVPPPEECTRALAVLEREAR
ncbi:hypothetical protein GCM10010307_50320 [Streptomyces vastus]|uniref:Secreted protein n=1 Tax=Streptomyces vastus TaxID=285451 RepID=A0ABP6DHK6_9ACTN